MENILTSLAFSMYTNKGVYALFLGSGISSAAGIPTGWKIIEDLIQKIAAINGEECKLDPVQWYRNKYNESPDYSKLLDSLTQTSAERCNLMNPYFTPTDEESEQGIKKPTKAHKAIAQLIKKGYVKVIVTTNFDRLLEQALQEENITPTVIKTSDDIEGMLPLVHNKITIFKINGDYKDTRFLNTDGELSRYPDKIKSLFLTILNDYGIISCGWSAKWDIALKDIIRSCSNYRFGSYWTHLGTCPEELEEIVTQRKGKTIQIIDADSFFTELCERVDALENYNSSFHPLSAEIAIARLKKYIVKDEYRINLHDLIISVQEETFKNIQKCWQENSLLKSSSELLPAIEKYTKYTETILPVMINAAYWARPNQYSLCLKVIERFIKSPIYTGTYTEYAKNIYYFPLLFLIYGIGISCLIAKKYDLLAKLFALKNKERTESYFYNIISRINSGNLITIQEGREIWENTSYTPLNNYIFKILQPYYISFTPDEEKFSDYFDLFEFLYLLHIRHFDTTFEKKACMPVRFGWNEYVRNPNNLIDKFKKEAEEQKDDFSPIKVGLFDGRYNNYKAAIAEPIVLSKY